MRILYRTADAKGSSQSIARIDRTARKVLISRSFVRLVLLWVIDRQWTVTERHSKYRPPRKYRPRIDRLEMSRFAGLSSPPWLLRSVRSIR